MSPCSPLACTASSPSAPFVPFVGAITAPWSVTFSPTFVIMSLTALPTVFAAGLLYALGTDSRVHTYSALDLEALSGYVRPALDVQDPYAHTHASMQTNLFYVKLAASPCGRWLASGNAADERAYLLDAASKASVARAREVGAGRSECDGGVELKGQGAMDKLS
ncbi:hypothetical protein LXA43DRAFT_1119503 [Ganoderma leucocontextum]|nr:hypothetical protein LXA43DRAFT_1119503 [Ganoderma leucocontextum]